MTLGVNPVPVIRRSSTRPPHALLSDALLALLAGALLATRGRLARAGLGTLAAAYLVVAGGPKVAQIVGIGIAVVGPLWLAQLGLRRTAAFGRSEMPS